MEELQLKDHKWTSYRNLSKYTNIFYTVLMKLGYPCINTNLSSRAQRTFRLASFSEQRFRDTVDANILGLAEIIAYNIKNDLLFLRIGSGLIPFASHPVCTIPWQSLYAPALDQLGKKITTAGMRISMHPDQFTLINSQSEEIFQRTVKELLYHADVLELLGLDTSAKIQIHVGGVYGDKTESIKRFIVRFKSLPQHIQERLVIENDDRLYSIQDCMDIFGSTGIPVLYDSLHHEILNNNESHKEAMKIAFQTWKEKDGLPMIDYSQQEKGARIGNHAKTLDPEEFKTFLQEVRGLDFDMMFEIKDKETSVLRAKKILNTHAT